MEPQAMSAWAGGGVLSLVALRHVLNRGRSLDHDPARPAGRSGTPDDG
jgi:hypothetical protein